MLRATVDPLGRRHWDGDRFSAAVCRRGHTVSSAIELNEETPPEHCLSCGARVLTQCPQCMGRILGSPVTVAMPYWPSDFCSCGVPYPWASEQAIVYHIENQLEEEPDLSEGDRRELEAQLRVLTDREQNAKRRASAYTAIKRAVPKVWAVTEPALRVFLTTEVQQHLPQ